MARKQSIVLLDTHIAVWLYAGLEEKLSRAASEAIEAHRVVLPQVGRLELEYLFEIGRIKVSAARVTADLAGSVGLSLSDFPVGDVVSEALRQKWTRDVFDRLIAAEAVVRRVGLITADEEIRKHYSGAIW